MILKPASAPEVEPAPERLPQALQVPATTLFHNLQVSADRYPEKAAYAFHGRSLSYRELLRQAEALAGWLQAQGVRAGDRVILDMQNCPQFVIAFYAVLRADAVVVPISPMYGQEELDHYLCDSDCRLVICAEEVVQHFVSGDPSRAASRVERILVARYADWMESAADPSPGCAVADVERANRICTAWLDALEAAHVPGPHTAAPSDMALLPYTSGTTAMPKGCIHTHATLMHNTIALGLWPRMTAESRSLAVAPMFHITGLVSAVLTNVYLGATAHVMLRWDRERAARLIEAHKLTHFVCIPTMVIDLLASPNCSSFDLSSLHNLIGGGTAMPEAVARRLKDEFGLTFVEGYGLTETAAIVTCNPLTRAKSQCLGVPVFGNDARIIDPSTGLELPGGGAGELVIHGPSIFRGYWRQPEATEAAFIDIDGKRFFRTGDLVCADEEGYFFLQDRLKRIINCSGYKVSPAEVEAFLYRHPAIQEACVVGAIDAYRGEVVKAIVVVRPDHRAGFSGSDFTAWSRGQMAVYKAPRLVQVVESLPKSPSGKVLWKVLQEAERITSGQPNQGSQ